MFGSSSSFHKNPFSDMIKFKECLDECATNNPTVGPVVKQSEQWNPYVSMGGASAAISGPDYVVVASDTRMSQFEVNIMTRECEKIYTLSDKIVLATCGFYGDALQLERLLTMRIKHFKFTYQQEMPVDMFASMLARTLYYRRFFPYYTGSILAGIDDDGKGAVYSYDPIGTIKQVSCECTGAGAQIMQPYFDALIDKCTVDESKRPKKPMELEQAKKLMRDAFRVVAERESSTGDSIKLVWVKAGEKPQQEIIPLRED